VERAQVRCDISLTLVLSILGGVFIIAGGLGLLAILGWHSSMFGGSMFGSMMGGGWHMFMVVYPYWLTATMIAVSLSAGAMVVVSAYKMYKEPENKQKWGFLIVLGSIAALFCIGGFGLGGILGLIGGLISMSGKS
jgi:hypothetical protein